jgi:hypothetical protein
MGQFGSKGGLRKILPLNDNHSSDRVGIPFYFRRVALNFGSDDSRQFSQERLVHDITGAANPSKKEKKMQE